MRKIFGVRALAFMAPLLAVTVIGIGVAQERSSTAGSSQEPTSGSPSGQSAAGQDRSESGQTVAGGKSAESGESPAESGTAAQAERNQRQRQRGPGGQDPQSAASETRTESQSAAAGDEASERQGLDRKIAHWLIVGNMGEVTLGQFAGQHAQHDSVKQFAQHMVQDHSQAIEKLHQVAQGGSAADVGTNQSTSRSGQTTTPPGATPPSSRDQSRSSSKSQEGASGQSSQSGASNLTQDRSSSPPAGSSSSAGKTRRGQGSQSRNGQSSQLGQSGQPSSPSQPVQPGQSRPTLSQDQSSSRADRTTLGSTQTDPSNTIRTQGFRGEQALSSLSSGDPLLQLKAEIGRRCGELTQRELAAKQGAEFDKAYIGQQIVAHIDMLATLQAIQQHASSELQPVIQQGIQKTEQHLSQAKQIMEQLASQGSDSQPRRSSGSDLPPGQPRSQPSGQSSGQPSGN